MFKFYKKLKRFLLLMLFSLGFLPMVFGQCYPFQNTHLPDSTRINNLISLMTLQEKVNALSTSFGVPRLGIRSVGQVEGLHGLALGGPGNWGNFGSRKHITYPTTIFPQAYGLGETWDTALIHKVANIEATEARYYVQNPNLQKGGLVVRAPNADLARDPRWGRTEESYGEDPYLASCMTVAFVKGLQGNNPRYWKAASLMKHFMANSNEDSRDSTSSNFDEQLFREYYGYTFYKGITVGGARAMMASYNAWNGTAMCINPVLNKVVRKEWGNNGIICTDADALHLLISSHKAFPTLAQGVAAIIKAGVGQILDNYKPSVYKALKKGYLTVHDIDRVLKYNFYVALRLGLLDGNQTKVPYANIGVTDTTAPWRNPKVHQFVRLVTAKSVVLLKNSEKLLPINKHKIKSIAVIGPLANKVLLDWYSGTPPYKVTILQGIKNAVGKNVVVRYAPNNDVSQAEKAAKESDIAIVCIGNRPAGPDPERWMYSPVASDGREGVDRKSLTLSIEDLAKVVYKANPHTVLVLVSSFPFAINWSQAHLPAILQVTHSSQELGNGVADVLFGKVDPAGRTTQTWVKSIADLPPMMDYNIRDGRTYMYFKGKPLYPFGYGLSYTSFSYSGLKTNERIVHPNDTLKISFKIKNTGHYDGDEVPQLYVSFPNSKVKRPIEQLKGFCRVFIKAGETKQVTFPLKASDLTYWNTNRHAFTIEPGKVILKIGSSSKDIKLTKSIVLR